jgi:hypothetical protein
MNHQDFFFKDALAILSLLLFAKVNGLLPLRIRA